MADRYLMVDRAEGVTTAGIRTTRKAFRHRKPGESRDIEREISGGYERIFLQHASA
jgi:hypothetical protein